MLDCARESEPAPCELSCQKQSIRSWRRLDLPGSSLAKGFGLTLNFPLDSRPESCECCSRFP